MTDENKKPLSDDALEVFLEAMITGDPSAAIENQEARGQRQFVNSSRLPIEIDGRGTREQFEAMGIVYGDPIDDLFTNVTLPAGWKFKATDHSMWSKLLDDKGRERASIFYKAAFYDRRAFINIERRYTYNYRPVNGWGAGDSREYVGIVKDCGKEIWISEVASDTDKPWNASEKVTALAKAWLEQRYPDYENPLAYWNED